jgi:hypothetical protein
MNTNINKPMTVAVQSEVRVGSDVTASHVFGSGRTQIEVVSSSDYRYLYYCSHHLNSKSTLFLSYSMVGYVLPALFPFSLLIV